MWFDSACPSAELGVGAEESKTVGLGGTRDERRFRRGYAEKISGTGVGGCAGSSYSWRGRRAGKATKPQRSPDHHLPNEQNHGPRDPPLEAENPNAVWATETDSGTVPPFKYPFGFARKRIESGGWTRQVTARELPISKSIAGVEMRLTAGGVRELHWHVSAEWAIMLYGNARITAVDVGGKSFVSDVGEGDLWLFPPGVPHSIQGLGPDGCQFLLVFDDGNFNEFESFADRLACAYSARGVGEKFRSAGIDVR